MVIKNKSYIYIRIIFVLNVPKNILQYFVIKNSYMYINEEISILINVFKGLCYFKCLS